MWDLTLSLKCLFLERSWLDVSWLSWEKAKCHFCLLKRNCWSQVFTHKIRSPASLITGLNCMEAKRFLAALRVWKHWSAYVWPLFRAFALQATELSATQAEGSCSCHGGHLRLVTGSWRGLRCYCIGKYLSWLCRRKTWSISLINVPWLKFIFLSPGKGVGTRTWRSKELQLNSGYLKVFPLQWAHAGGGPRISKLKH